MHNLGINVDLSISLNANYVKSLLGELLSLQLEHSTEERKATNEYFRYKSVHTVYAVSLMPHATEDAYKRYHRKAPYIQELIDVMVKNQSADVGPIRLATYLATNHEKLYVDVAMQKGLAITGIMDEVESAAMWRDARVLDNQARTILRHLRYKFESKITVPFSKQFNLLEGYTEPKVKVFEHHVNGEKYPEMVHVQYQDVAQELKLCVEELLDEHAVKPGAVCKIRMVIGGDHGQGAFRLCFRVVINLKNKKKPIHKIKAVAEVYSSKEEGVVLEKSIMSWLKEDMEKIAQSALTISIDENPNNTDAQDNAQSTQVTNENQDESVIYSLCFT